MKNKIDIHRSDFKPTQKNIFVWLNAVFLISILILGYADTLTIVMAYFLETIIIGMIQVLKMYRVVSTSKTKNYFLIPFFIFHYSFFVAVQLIFVFVFLEMKDNNIREPFNLIENILYVLSYKGMKIVLISILIYNLGDYFINFIRPKVYKTITVDKLFMQPYVRIFIQQFAVILGGFFILIFSGLFVVAILIILFRTLIELHFIANPNSKIFDSKHKLNT